MDFGTVCFEYLIDNNYLTSKKPPQALPIDISSIQRYISIV